MNEVKTADENGNMLEGIAVGICHGNQSGAGSEE
jgi:hypothetical protein